MVTVQTTWAPNVGIIPMLTAVNCACLNHESGNAEHLVFAEEGERATMSHLCGINLTVGLLNHTITT